MQIFRIINVLKSNENRLVYASRMCHSIKISIEVFYWALFYYIVSYWCNNFHKVFMTTKFYECKQDEKQVLEYSSVCVERSFIALQSQYCETFRIFFGKLASIYVSLIWLDQKQTRNFIYNFLLWYVHVGIYDITQSHFFCYFCNSILLHKQTCLEQKYILKPITIN